MGFRPKPRFPLSDFSRLDFREKIMTSKRKGRNFEAPDSNVATHYSKQKRNWDRYDTDGYYGYFDEEERKPAVILECIDQDLKFNAKTAYFLRKKLKKNPQFLDHFIDDWLVENAAPIEPSLGSSGSNKPKRRVAPRPK